MNAIDLTVSPNPHIHSGARISGTAYHTLLALVPAVVLGIVYYGLDAVRVIGASVASAMLAEALMQAVLKRPVRIADGSAAASGLLLALILPASVPFYVVVVANFAGIIVGKQVFGGLGANPLNPALVGWAIVRITQTWAAHLNFDLALVNYDAGFALQYPLAVLKGEGAAGVSRWSLPELLLGRQAGGIGASGVVWVLAGGLYLVSRGIVRWQIPLCFMLGLMGVAGIFWLGDRAVYASPLFHLFTGNAVIGAFFLATDRASSPVNPWGMVVYGLGCGALTIVLRVWSVYPDGVVFACLLMGLFVPLLDKLKARQILPAGEGITVGEEE